MLRYLVDTGYGEGRQESAFFHSFEIPKEEQLTNWYALTSLDKDKYIKMDDGSELFARIMYVSSDYVRTSGGTFRIKDIVHCAIPKYPYAGYSGASSKNESFEVRPPSRNELAKVNQILAGEKIKGRMTERVKMLSLERLQERVDGLNINEEFIVDQLAAGVIERDKGGRRDSKWLEALKILGKIKGTDLENPSGLDPKNQIEQGVNRFAGQIQTVQDMRKRSGAGKTISDAIIVSKFKKSAEEVEVLKQDSVEYHEDK